MMRKVFLSYAREDRSSARILCQALRREGFDVWFDEDSLLGGQKWLLIIEKEIKRSDFFIALLSRSSIGKRGVVQKEMREALRVLETLPEDKIFVIPVRLEDCEPSFSILREIHWIDLFPDWDAGLSQVLHAVDRDRGSADLSEREMPFDLSLASWGIVSATPTPVVLPISDILRGILAKFDDYAEARNVIVRLFDSSDGAQGMADREALSLALSIVINNAVKYSFSSAKRKGVIRLGCEMSGSFVRIGVENIGPPVDADRITDAGTGISAARKAMRSFGGDIVVESRPLRKTLSTVAADEPFVTKVVILVPMNSRA